MRSRCGLNATQILIGMFVFLQDPSARRVDVAKPDSDKLSRKTIGNRKMRRSSHAMKIVDVPFRVWSHDGAVEVLPGIPFAWADFRF